jgi:predicted CopG family antitoxin
MESKSNLEIVAEMFIQETEREVERIKRKGSNKEKLRYLNARIKHGKKNINKEINKLITNLRKNINEAKN